MVMAGESAEMPKLLTPAETSNILRVTQRTLSLWAKAGKIEAVMTPTGHRLYAEADVRAIAEGRKRPASRDTAAHLTG